MADLVNQAPFFAVFLLLILGFVCLIKGADIFVSGSSSVAKRFHVPSIIIGLTIVAMGTSLPETAVSVTASLANNNELAISNAIGSNIFNLMVVIGVCALITSVNVAKETVTRDIPISLCCALLLLGLGLLPLADPVEKAEGVVGYLGHLDGIILIIIFICYILFLIRAALKARKEGANASGDEEEEIKLLSMPKSIIFILLGGGLIAIGGELTVDSASRIAIEFGMSQTLVGLTIASIGTSLPELVTSIVAARKNELDMALGNAVGSNVFNILMVLGIASAISPIALITFNVIDIAILLAFSILVWILAASKRKINRIEGLIMVTLYVAYAVYIVIR
ncbi:MAG: calcium/sodium antiporter [Lachnospiraceae bacterium]